jgi:replicative DNA helicase
MELTNNPECQVLGALLLEPDYIFQIQEVLSEEDFSSSRHRKIFKAILATADNCDVFTVADELGDIDENIVYLSDMTDACPTSKNILAYAQVVLESGRQRKLRALSQMILESQQSKEKSEVILDKLGEALSLISTNGIGNTQTTLNEALKLVVNSVSSRMEGEDEVYRTGFDELDEYMPFSGGSLYLLGGLSGGGKSTLLQSFLETQVFNDVPCYFNSAEMSAESVAKRFLQSAGSIRSNFFNEPAKHMSTQIGQSMTAGLLKLKDKNLMIDDQQGLTVEQLRVRARNWVTTQPSYIENGKAVLAVDYAQLLSYDHRNSASSLGIITKELRALAKELGIVVILLVQLNNDYKNRPDKRPIPSDIAGSSEMLKDADGCIFCYRDVLFNPDTLDKEIIELIIGKNRNGAQGTVRALCELEYFRISDIKNKY